MKSFFKIILISFLALICSCNNNDVNEIREKLQGDWRSTKVYEYSFFFIRDSLAFMGNYNEDTDYYPYRIEKDTIIFCEDNSKINIARITDKYIWTYDEKSEIIYPLFEKADLDTNDNISLKSLEIRFNGLNNQGLADWSLYIDDSLNCYMEVIKNRKRKINKRNLDYPEGQYFAKVPKRDFELYQKKFRYFPLGKLKKEYKSIYYGVSSCLGGDSGEVYLKCNFIYNNTGEENSIATIVKGSFSCPRYLRMFFISFINICSELEFEQAEKKHNFEFYNGNK